MAVHAQYRATAPLRGTRMICSNASFSMRLCWSISLARGNAHVTISEFLSTNLPLKIT